MMLPDLFKNMSSESKLIVCMWTIPSRFTSKITNFRKYNFYLFWC